MKLVAQLVGQPIMAAAGFQPAWARWKAHPQAGLPAPQIGTAIHDRPEVQSIKRADLMKNKRIHDAGLSA